MSGSDREEKVLYVKTINSEWKLDAEVAPRSFKERCDSLLENQGKGSAWSYLRNLSLSQTNLDCYSPSVSKLINSQSAWKLVLSNSKEYLAVLQDDQIEIRPSENDFTDIVSEWAVPSKDLFPQWRCLTWSPDDSLVSVSDSGGNVFVYDLIGNQLSHISPRQPLSYDLSNAVCSLFFKEMREAHNSEGQHWFCELLVLTYQGILCSYAISQEGDHKFTHTYNFKEAYPNGVVHSAYLPSSSLLLVGGGTFFRDGAAVVDDSEGDSMLRHGISAWRVLSGPPYYKQTTDYDFRPGKTSMLSKKFAASKWFSFSNGHQGDQVFKMATSPDGRLLATLHASESICIWSLPSLQLIKKFPPSDQPDRDYVDPDVLENPKKRKSFKDFLEAFYITDVAWWSNEDIIITRGTGSLTVSTIENLRNRIGASPEFFQPELGLLRFSDGCFYVLECQKKYGTSKREMVQSESEDADGESFETFVESEDESGEGGGWSKRVTKYVRHGLFYVTDMDAFQPARKRPKMVRRSYRLVCLKSTTPEELYASKLDSEEYGEALLLAKAYNLDCDLTYQRQWKKLVVSVATIQDYLAKISKRSWVLHECLERVPQSLDAVVELLKYGMRGTDLEALIAAGRSDDDGKFVLCEIEEGVYRSLEEAYNPDDSFELEKEALKKRKEELLKQIDFDNLTFNQKELCRIRQKLLHYHDKLETYQEILGGKHYAYERYESGFFDRFRSRNILELAVEFAQESNISAMSSLFTYHGQELLPHRMAILNCIPETTPPELYAELLPKMNIKGGERSFENWNCFSWRDEMDWCEQFSSFLNPMNADDNDNDTAKILYEENPEFVKFRGSTLTDEQLTAWYTWRSLQIEKMSGQVDCSIELVRLGIQNNVKDLSDLYEDLETMQTLVYDCYAGTKFTFEELLRMDNIARMNLMMAKTTREMFVKNLRRWVVPYLRKQELETKGSYNRFLKEYMVSMAANDLTYVELIFKESREEVAEPIITDVDDLVAMASECLYAHSGYDQLSMMKCIVQCLPDTITNEKKNIQNESGDVKHILSNHLLGLEILKKNGIEQTMAQIRDVQKSESEALKIFTRIARTSTKKRPPMSNRELEVLLSDMCLLQEKVFSCIPKPISYEIFVGALLCSGVPSHIDMAGTAMQPGQLSGAAASSEQIKQPPSKRSATSVLKDSFRSTISPLRGATKSGVDTARPTSAQTPGDLLSCSIDRDKSIHLVLDAAKEYFNSSASVSDHDMSLARSCLNLIKDKPEVVQDELNLIEALAMLESLGVNMLPVQVRMTEDRLSLVRKVLTTRKMMYKNYTKLFELGRLLKVAEKDDLQGRILVLIGQCSLQAKDYSVCLDSCKKLVSMNYQHGWEICMLLGKETTFNNEIEKSSLLKFALLHCPDDQLNHLLDSSSKLQSKIIYHEVTKNMPECDPNLATRSAASQLHQHYEEDDATSSSSSSKLEKALISQTRQVISLTRSAIGHIGDRSWWSGVVGQAAGGLKKLKGPERSRRNKSRGIKSGSPDNDHGIGFTKQTCHPFYEALYQHSCCRADQTSAVDYSDAWRPTKTPGEVLDVREQVIRMYISDMERFTSDDGCGDDDDGHGSYDLISQVLVQSAESTLPHDTGLGLAYLLALPDVFSAEQCFDHLPKTLFLHQLAVYYFALRISERLKTSDLLPVSDVYNTMPSLLVKQVVGVVSSGESNWPPDVKKMIDRMFHYNDLLLDYLEAETIKKVDDGIDISRFVSDDSYKEESILGMAMTQKDELLDVALRLASRYGIPTKNVYMAHLEYVFDATSMTTDEIETRINKLNVLKILQQHPTWFTNEMQEKILPLIHGQDLNRLLVYYTCLMLDDQGHTESQDDLTDMKSHGGEGEGIVARGDKSAPTFDRITPQIHVRMLRRFKNLAPKLNYKDLTSGKCDLDTVLTHVLDANNVLTFAKFAQHFSDSKGRNVDPSFIYRCFATKTFNSGLDVENFSDWSHRYDDCHGSIQKMSPNDFLVFVTDILFGLRAVKKISVGTRKQILKRSVKYSRQKVAETKKVLNNKNAACSVTWEEVTDELQKVQTHLERMCSEVLTKMASSDNSTWRQYALEFDLTRSRMLEVRNFFKKLILAGEEVELIGNLVELVDEEGLKCGRLYADVLEEFFATYKSKSSDKFLKTVKGVCRQIYTDASQRVKQIDKNKMNESLSKFASNQNIDAQTRLEILSIIRESSPTDCGDDILYSQTSAVLSLFDSRANELATPEKVSDERGRISIFENLIDFQVPPSQLLHLVQLLNIWPPLSENMCVNLWLKLIEKLINVCQDGNNNGETMQSVFQLICDAITKKNINVKETEYIANLIEQKDPISACKIQIMSSDDDMKETAIRGLQVLPAETDDKMFFQLLLDRHLVQYCTSAPFYPKLVDFIMSYETNSNLPEPVDQELADATSSQVHATSAGNSVLSALKDLSSSGQKPEAGTLMMAWKSIHRSLRNFDAALSFSENFF